MTTSYGEHSEAPSADYEVSYQEGVCIDVGWTTEERQELYNVEWEEPLHEEGLLSNLNSLFR